MPRMPFHRTSLILLASAATIALVGCKGSQTAGNAIEMRDMEVVDGTVNDSMTDLDAVKADGLGVVDNAGNVSRPGGQAEKVSNEAMETVATE